ncbi:MAG: OmpH family outer membrane protein [Opitutales bacterium]|nr:OmpH family outer membrane protein [Opitutales bacterium]
MKKIIAIMAMLAGSAALYAESIYVVDILQVRQNYYKTKVVAEQLQSAAASADAELKTIADNIIKIEEEMKPLVEKYNNPALADAAKKEIENELKEKDAKRRELANSFNAMKRQAQERLAAQDREVSAEHIKEIMKVVEQIAAEKKADFIIEKRALLFSKPTADITEDVISALNANAPKK